MGGDEGNVYVVCWKPSGKKLRAWVRDNPSISCTAATLREAGDEIYFALMEQTGDGEAVLEFDPPAPVASGETYVALSYNDRVEISNERSELFEGGICGRCRCGIGARSEAPMVLAKRPKADVFRAEQPWPNDVYPTRTCVSDRFVALLSPTEVAILGLMPMDAPPKSTTRYFEICGNPIASAVGQRGDEYLTKLGQSWRCSECGRAAMMSKSTKFPPGATLVAQSELSKASRDCFIFDQGGSVGPRPAFSVERWRSLLASAKALKGLCSSPVIAIPDDEADLSPDLPDYLTT